ncbi:MAG: zf-TFIIB domain-containing protein [Elusimicrobiota bacterium]
MLCPKCEKSELTAHRVNMLLETDHCARCGGVWFDQQEVYARIKRPAQFFEVFKAAYADSTDTKYACPRDGKPMIQATIEAAELPFEACTQCGGMWFDEGEVEKLNRYLDDWDACSAEGPKP